MCAKMVIFAAMKRLPPLVVFAFSLVLIVTPLLAATAAASKPAADRSPVSPLATTLSTVTGIAISPLLGTSAYGIYKYFAAKTSEEKAALPWFAKISFWLPALLIVGACAAKDSLGAIVPPGMKKPLDVLETLENKASGLVAAGAVVPLTMASLSHMLVSSAAHPAVAASGLATIQVAAIDFSWLLNLLTVPFGVAMFALVWMASHAINVLILLSPWGAIDAALKSARTALLGLLTLTATINPWIGAALSVVVIVIAYFVAGWAFRLTIFGSVFCWDFFTGRKGRFQPAERENWVFSASRLTKLGVPVRTYGRLVAEPENGRWGFVYRPWLFGAERRVEVRPDAPAIGRGLFFSTVRDGDGTLLLLPPRYRGHEEKLAQLYAIAGGVQDAGLLKAWGALKELFGGSAARAQVA
jgi:hypothetical protein